MEILSVVIVIPFCIQDDSGPTATLVTELVEESTKVPPKCGLESVVGYLFDSTDDTALQAHLDSVGMGAGFCQNIGNNAVCEYTRALILLPDNLNLHSHFNISSMISVHYNCLPLAYCHPEKRFTGGAMHQ